MPFWPLPRHPLERLLEFMQLVAHIRPVLLLSGEADFEMARLNSHGHQVSESRPIGGGRRALPASRDWRQHQGESDEEGARFGHSSLLCRGAEYPAPPADAQTFHAICSG